MRRYDSYSTSDRSIRRERITQTHTQDARLKKIPFRVHTHGKSGKAAPEQGRWRRRSVWRPGRCALPAGRHAQLVGWRLQPQNPGSASHGRNTAACHRSALCGPATVAPACKEKSTCHKTPLPNKVDSNRTHSQHNAGGFNGQRMLQGQVCSWSLTSPVGTDIFKAAPLLVCVLPDDKVLSCTKCKIGPLHFATTRDSLVSNSKIRNWKKLGL